MNVSLFLTLLTFGAAIAGLMTEAIKTAMSNAGKEYSANIIALITSVLVGGFGTSTTYVLMGIPFTASNILCIVLMVFAMWIGAMIGYDKLIQTIKQLLDKGGE